MHYIILQATDCERPVVVVGDEKFRVSTANQLNLAILENSQPGDKGKDLTEAVEIFFPDQRISQVNWMGDWIRQMEANV